jgi:hypothetical protein
MPQSSYNNNKSKKKGRAPAHQNTFAFRHNPKSKLTDKILSSPIEHVCRKCQEKLEWRKKYRKYKPRSQPGKCNLCQHKNVMAAYHTICTSCSTSDEARIFMKEKKKQESTQRDDDTPSDEAVEIDNDDSSAAYTAADASYCHRVCAICVREPALEDDGDGNTETLDDILAREGRHRIRLREQKALERKLEREQGTKAAKQATANKEARRAAAAQQQEESDGVLVLGEDNVDDQSFSEKEAQSTAKDDNDDEDDPFLKAVGGADKLLTGEAYQQMLLERATKGMNGK